MSDLSLMRSLSIEGHQYTTEVTVHEVATDDDSGAAIFLSQDPEEGEGEPDVVALTWAEWAEVAGHVDAARGMMPDGSENQPSYCGSASSQGYLCLVARDQRHTNHVDSDGFTWRNASAEPEPEF